ncbi:MAG: hypothetical protein U9N18_04040 [Campylobacterota bacterium]|nr:hypothetical protein [Campylobacterota bacterium]
MGTNTMGTNTITALGNVMVLALLVKEINIIFIFERLVALIFSNFLGNVSAQPIKSFQCEYFFK